MADGDSVTLQKFSGLRNTVSPERLGPDELARGRNIDLDDAGQPHRRRGYRVAALGSFHSLFSTAHGHTYVVKDGVLCYMLPSYQFVKVMPGIANEPLCYCEIGPTLYASNGFNSFQVDLATNVASAWGLVRDPSYRPGLTPGPVDWWYSPVANPRSDLPPIRGRLLGAPKPCTTMAYFNGRIYMGAGRELWATELFLYNYVDKTRGYRQFEGTITCLAAVEDGVWVGTADGLYFLSGRWGEEQRSVKMLTAILPGSAVEVPADMISPNARNRLDLPSQSGLALAMMSSEGLLACLPGGQVFNLTRAQYVFPDATRAAALFRYQDGMHTVIQALDSQGSPAQDAARFGDYMDATIIRASQVTGQEEITTSSTPEGVGAGLDVVSKGTQPTLIIEGLDGTDLGEA